MLRFFAEFISPITDLFHLLRSSAREHKEMVELGVKVAANGGRPMNNKEAEAYDLYIDQMW